MFFFGLSNDFPVPNPEEVADWKYMSFAAIDEEMEANPEKYTTWFKLMLEKIKSVRNESID